MGRGGVWGGVVCGEGWCVGRDGVWGGVVCGEGLTQSESKIEEEIIITPKRQR